jgi:hypothetical protein
MVQEMSKTIFSLLTVGCLFTMTAAPPSIGFVRSAGDFRVDGSVVRGNSTVFDGNVIETAAARSVIQIDNVEFTLAPASRAKVYRDRSVLEKGTGTLRDADSHVLEAASLRISPSAKDSVVQVDLKSASRVTVLAISGTALVRNSSGLLIASLRSGMALAFDAPPGNGSLAVKLTGTVTEQGGEYFLTDSTANVTAELWGADLSKDVGKETQITGSIVPDAKPAAGASEVVQVTGAKILAKGAGSAGAAAAAGHSTAATVAIFGGVTVAGTLAGLAAAGSFNGAPSTSAQ